MRMSLQTFKDASLAVLLLIFMNHIWHTKYLFLVTILVTHLFKYSSVQCGQ